LFDRVEFLPLVLGENRPLVFDFTNDLQVGETITSGTLDVTTYSGTDATPSTLLQGSATVASPKVSQNAKPTIAGVVYNVLGSAVTDLGNTYCKTAFLAVLPVANTTTDAPSSTVSAVVASFDTGLTTLAISPTPLLTAITNASGGKYQVNVSAVVSSTGSSGYVDVTVSWVDRLSGITLTNLTPHVSVTALIGQEGTFPIDTLAASQVLIQVDGTGFSGASFTYQAECTVTRL